MFFVSLICCSLLFIFLVASIVYFSCFSYLFIFLVSPCCFSCLRIFFAYCFRPFSLLAPCAYCFCLLFSSILFADCVRPFFLLVLFAYCVCPFFLLNLLLIIFVHSLCMLLLVHGIPCWSRHVRLFFCTVCLYWALGRAGFIYARLHMHIYVRIYLSVEIQE